jgi:hypothetical protein
LQVFAIGFFSLLLRTHSGLGRIVVSASFAYVQSVAQGPNRLSGARRQCPPVEQDLLEAFGEAY